MGASHHRWHRGRAHCTHVLLNRSVDPAVVPWRSSASAPTACRSVTCSERLSARLIRSRWSCMLVLCRPCRRQAQKLLLHHVSHDTSTLLGCPLCHHHKDRDDFPPWILRGRSVEQEYPPAIEAKAVGTYFLATQQLSWRCADESCSRDRRYRPCSCRGPGSIRCQEDARGPDADQTLAQPHDPPARGT